MNNKWQFVFLLLIVLMGMSTLKVSYILTFKFYQLIIPILFIIFLLDDLLNRKLNIKIISFLFISSILLSLISLNSTYEKIGEIKFIIKYIVLFPASFYIGYKFIEKLNIQNIVRSYEIFAIIHLSIAILFLYYPIEFLYHRRGSLPSFQGTFWEPSGLGMALGLALLIIISLRYEFKLVPKKPLLYFSFIIAIVIAIIYAKTKAFWFATSLSLVFIIFDKIFSIIIKYKYLEISKNFKLPFILKLKLKYIIAIIIISSITIALANSLMENPFISKEIIKEKLETERGLAFIKAIELLENSKFIGGYGWGFIEAYFSNRNLGIVGLGEGVSMIFNSYLNEWITVGIIGLMFHLILLKIAYSKKHLFTMLIPLYLFFLANVHPLLGSEVYYFTLGLSYGLKKFY